MLEPISGTALALVAAKALGGAAGKELAQRVADLVGLVDAQKKLLSEIRRDVRALVEGPQRTALIHLGDARNARSAETQLTCLMAARTELARAAAQETDPLRRSYAWLLLAAVWAATAEDEGRIIAGHLEAACLSAVEAAMGMADPAPEPRTLRFLGSLRLITAPLWLTRIEAKRRPASVRLEVTGSLGAPGIGAVQFEEYVATKTAIERERQLVDVHRYACGLRELLIKCDQARASLPSYRVALVHGISFAQRWPRTTAVLWALTYTQVPAGQSIEPCDTPLPLSEGRVAVKFRRRKH